MNLIWGMLMQQSLCELKIAIVADFFSFDLVDNSIFVNIILLLCYKMQNIIINNKSAWDYIVKRSRKFLRIRH